MPAFRKQIEKKIQDFDVVVYDVEPNNENASKLEEYLVKKIKSIKLLNKLNQYTEYLKAPNLSPEFSQKLQDSIKELANPAEHKIKAFDVRRSYVTEFLSQLLLERQYNCVFHEHADKKLNVDPVMIEKHTPGIDVTGIQFLGETLKFAVCEVKASKSPIPCTETASLLSDIKNSHDFSKKRLAREIMSYCNKLMADDADEKLVQNVVQFLAELLTKKNDQEHVLNNVIFFPFLLRKNDDILGKKDVGDYNLFAEEKFPGSTITGVIWSFNEDIDSFCSTIWDKALKVA